MKKLIVMISAVLAMLPAIAADGLPNLFGEDNTYSVFKNIKLPYNASAANIVYQDRQGMIWLGTSNGLFSYNGYNLHNYLTDKNPERNSVQGIVQTDGKYLCIATYGGIRWMNLKTGRWEERHPALNRLHALRALRMYKGKLWIGTYDSGIYYYDLSACTLHHSLISNHQETGVYAIEPVGDKIFFGSYEGFSCLDLTTMKRRVIPLDGNKGKFVNSLLYNPRERSVLVGTEGCLYRYEIATDRCTPLPLLRGKVFKTLARDAYGNLLIGTDTGLYMYNAVTGVTRHFLHDTRNTQSICNNIVWNITCDRESNVWLCTDNGISVTQHTSWYRMVNLLEISGTGDGNIFSQIMCDSHGCMWMGGENGLLRVAPMDGGNDVKWYNANNPEYTLVHNRVRQIYEDRAHNIWIATDGNIARYDIGSKRFVYYKLTDGRGHNSQWAYSVYEDMKGRLWITSYAGGLFIVDKKKLISNGKDNMNYGMRDNCSFKFKYPSHTLHIEPDDRNNVWLWNNGELTRVNVSTMQTRHAMMHIDKLIYCNDALWIADNTNIYRYDTRTGQKKQIDFHLSSGIVNTFVREGHNVWFSCVDGIYYIDTRNNLVHSVNMPEGTYLSGFYNNRTHEIVWGGEDNIVFYSLNQPAHRLGYVSITSVLSSGILLISGAKMKTEMPLYTKEIELSSGENITFEISTMSYNPQQNEVFYYQLGKNTSWHSLKPGQNQIQFANIPSGTYQLRLSATNPLIDGNAKISVYNIYVPRPWYLSYPALFVYLLIVSGGVIALLKYQQIRNRRRYELREKEKSLELSRLKMDFFENISHELKTPLSLIIAPLSKLIPEMSNNLQRQTLVSVQTNALRLNTLIHKILNFKQMEYESENTLIRSHVEMCQFLRNIIQTFAQTSAAKGVHIDFASDMDELWLNIDTLKMESVFINLISNALKYVPQESGRISVNLKMDENNVRISVEDNGMGIDNDEMKMVFIRFFQGRNSSVTKGGTGIGLYLVKKYVEMHGGSVDLQSHNGTTFIITLPINDENAIPETASDMPVTEINAKEHECILIVDDNHEIVDFLAGALTENYHCIKAYDGREALRAIEHTMPDLIIADQMMPGMSGFELCREIRHRQATATVPIIMLTAKDDMQTELESIKIGIDVFVPKPFDMKKITLQIARLIQKRRNMEKAVNISNITNPEFHPITDKPSPDERLIESVTCAVEENMEDEEFNVTMLAEKTGVDQKQLYRKVKLLTGMTPVAYIRKLRMKKAAVLLREKKFAVSEVMYLVGFSNASYFTKCFTEEFGMSPRQYVDQQKD
jgi:signal transduction histidine kinase/DNA-binding response OmpR family regulator/ligand-binding sensor domain-containing protein